jgi:hypothetical protein
MRLFNRSRKWMIAPGSVYANALIGNEARYISGSRCCSPATFADRARAGWTGYAIGAGTSARCTGNSTSRWLSLRIGRRAPVTTTPPQAMSSSVEASERGRNSVSVQKRPLGRFRSYYARHYRHNFVFLEPIRLVRLSPAYDGSRRRLHLVWHQLPVVTGYASAERPQNCKGMWNVVEYINNQRL